MALFVILIGALLILGGASSLLSGFDIAMTERGSAMTIAGTVALAGGAITVAIGFSLLRLSQILRVLQIEAEDEASIVVMPTSAAPADTVSELESIPKPTPVESAALALDSPKVDSEDTILTSPLKPKVIVETPKKSGFFRKSSNLAIGVGAGAAILAAGAAAASSTKETDAEELMKDQNILNEAEAESSLASSEGELPMNLEAELSRALAEDIPNTDISIPVSPVELQESVKPSEPISFNEGLTQVLSKPKKRGKRDSIIHAEDLEAEIEKNIPEASADGTDISDLVSETEEDAATDHAKSDNDTKSEDDNKSEDDSNQSGEGNNPSSEIENVRPTILGTYNAGDGTYVMYSDGTVEAITEQGIRMFKSMEELRKHLAQN